MSSKKTKYGSTEIPLPDFLKPLDQPIPALTGGKKLIILPVLVAIVGSGVFAFQALNGRVAWNEWPSFLGTFYFGLIGVTVIWWARWSVSKTAYRASRFAIRDLREMNRKTRDKDMPEEGEGEGEGEEI